MASTRGRWAAARRRESMTWSMCHCGSDWLHRVPEDLLAEHDLAVDHGGGLAVAGAEIEADPAAVEVAAQRDRGLALGRELGLRDADDLERDAEQLAGP